LLNPLRGLVAYGFFSHKLLRWIAPVLLVLLLAANLLALGRGPVYQASLGAQALLYLVAGLGYLRNGKTRNSKLLLIPFYFVSMNLALALGMFRAFSRKQGGAWRRIERSDIFRIEKPMARPATTSARMKMNPNVKVKEISS
jgi:hypothetical protein